MTRPKSPYAHVVCECEKCLLSYEAVLLRASNRNQDGTVTRKKLSKRDIEKAKRFAAAIGPAEIRKKVSASECPSTYTGVAGETMQCERMHSPDASGRIAHSAHNSFGRPVRWYEER